jgi:uncharacterized protein (UPF0276 family)
VLEQVRAHYPITCHGVSLSIGSTDKLNQTYLRQLKDFIAWLQPAWISEHLCWTGVNDRNMHDLFPLPYTEEAIKHVVERIKQVQDILGQQILIENVSSYITYKSSTISEWEFLATIAEQADCYILLDINNIYVSSYNHHFDPQQYLSGIPKQRIKQFHLAGHQNLDNHIIDTHDQPIINEVWSLYAEAIKHFGDIATIIERDDNIPEFPVLFAELMHAKSIATDIKMEKAHV